ncbi:MAG: DUF559 domain-containing protein [Candidatus Taylorbacteria bacterium]|nr:DUF559 domain-containing protein [Candidatus Taylorbacteria bacterium]
MSAPLMKFTKDKRKKRGNKRVLVGVLKSQSDRRILRRQLWYRIPVSFLPKRKFSHIAFYQPACFGATGKRITYYARVVGKAVKKRIELLPGERQHPRANEDYLKVSFKEIRKLRKPIRNVIPRRVSFGFTSLKRLCASNDMLELYGVPPTEQILEQRLRRLGIKTFSQHVISKEGKRYRLDLAIFCDRGNIAIECDNRKAHSAKRQKLKDKQKNASLKKLGWRVVRFTEADIVEHLDSSASRVRKLVRSLGGQA